AGSTVRRLHGIPVSTRYGGAAADRRSIANLGAAGTAARGRVCLSARGPGPVVRRRGGRPARSPGDDATWARTACPAHRRDVASDHLLLRRGHVADPDLPTGRAPAGPRRSAGDE